MSAIEREISRVVNERVQNVLRSAANWCDHKGTGWDGHDAAQYLREFSEDFHSSYMEEHYEDV